MQDIPVKYLGKEYKANIVEKEQIQFVTKQLAAQLKKIDRCKLPERYKGWIVQHIMMPRLLWPHSIYNIWLTTKEGLQRKITTALKKWLKVPRSFSTDCFYSKSTKLKLP